jgi:FAD/FMN-containing dehydrogenase
MPSPLNQIVLLPGGGAIARVTEEAAAFGRHRRAPFNYLVDAMSPDASDDEANISWARELAAALKPWAAGGAYLNFIGDEGEDRVVAAFGANTYTRLQALKDRYDPDNLFRLNQNVKPSGALIAEPGAAGPA